MTQDIALDIQESLDQVKTVLNTQRSEATVLAVSKRQPLERVEALLSLGHRYFAENQVQETAQKWPTLRQQYPDVAVHLVGPLQTNKAKQALTLYDRIHTLDRPSLAEKFASLAEQGHAIPPLLIQVNTGEEPQKAGVLPQEVSDFTTYCQKDLKLPVDGLMVLPPQEDLPTVHFAFLQTLARRVQLPHLSMGMSGDWQQALPFQPSFIRLGTALFGARPG